MDHPLREASSKPKDITSAVKHRHIRSNGIDIHAAEVGQGPLVILLHGFPELWYSWRHQLLPLADAGFRVLAPDLRGYGETDAPEAVESYSMRNMTADVIGLIDAMARETAVIIGHDWGARITWRCAELYPHRVAGVVALSVPYYPCSPEPPIQKMKQASSDTFNFALYFQEPGVAEAELEADVRQSLRRFLCALSGDAPPDVVQHLFTGKPAEAGVLDGMPDPEALPTWLTEADLDYYSQAFTRTGFRGALCRYRNLDRDWKELADTSNNAMEQPALFLAGERDSAVLFGSLGPMESALPNLRKRVLFPGCGHWVQQERPADVNAEIISFLSRNWS